MFTGSLKAFDATVCAGSIRKASEDLGVAPSSVSRHIAMLEREIGTALFDRKARGVQLTFAGTLVAEFTRSVLVHYDTLRTDLNDLRDVQRRLIRVAIVESVAGAGPVTAIRNFARQFPGVSFELKQLTAPQVIEAVRTDACDIGLTFSAEPDHEIACLATFREPIVVLAPAGHPLAAATQVQLDQLVNLPLALPDTTFGVRRILDRASAQQLIQLKPVLTSNTFATLRDFVRSGLGLAVLPRRACRLESGPDLCVLALADEPFIDAHIDLIVLRKRRLPRVVKAFVDTLVEAIRAAD